ncbi:MAG: hypothetical protein D6734_03260, partial [Candidatus Schekmanbacteria bacterium]
NSSFFYPEKGGIQSLIDSFEKNIDKIYKSEEVYRIDIRNKKVYLKSGSYFDYDIIISSLPLKELVSLIKRVPAKVEDAGKKLKCASLIIVNVGFKSQRKIKTQWYYLPDKDYECFRAGFYSAVSPSMAPPRMNSAYVEFSCGNRTQFPKIEKFEEKAVESLKNMGFLSSDNDVLYCKGIPVKYGYVIFDKSYENSVHRIRSYLERYHIYTIGRYGRWEYSAMTDAIMQGKEISAKITKMII